MLVRSYFATCFWFNTTGGWYGLFCLLEKFTDSDFAGLNLTSHFVAHWWIFDRSEFNWVAASIGLSTMIYRLVSSAKSLIEELMSSTISLMYKRKRKGPRTEPWGTPEFTDVQSEFAPGRTTLCFLLCRQSVNHWRSEPEIPAIWSLKKRPLCHTLSKALLMSQKTARTSLPASRALQKIL